MMSNPSIAYDLFYQAAEGSTSDLERALKSTPNWRECRDARGRTALMHSAIADNVKNFSLLVKKDCSLQETDNSEATALHWAALCGSMKVAKNILPLRSVVGRSFCLVGDRDGVTPLHVAASRSCSKMLKLLIDSLPKDEDVHTVARDRRGRSPLHYAASKASIECVKTFLEEKDILGFPVDQKDNNGLTPLMCAAGTPLPQAVDVCRQLAQRKVQSVKARNQDGQTALHLAVAANNIPVAKFLLEQDPNVPADNLDRTALHYAAEQGQLEMVRLVLYYGFKNNTRDRQGVTAAHYAAQSSGKCLQEIFERFDIQEVKDNEHRSCLMWAVCAGNIEAIEYLLRRGAERHDRDIRGFTALHLAAMVGNEAICKMLVKQGWNNTERDKKENTPLHLAAGRGHTVVVRYLVTTGAVLSEKDAMQRTPIFWACFGGQAHTLYCMIKEMGFEWRTADGERRARPIQDVLGRTPLHAAAYAGFTACINVLLSIEAEDNCLSAPLVGTGDHDGETALHVACSRGRLDCVLALLKGGAAINAINKSRRTPIETAEEKKHFHISEYLKTQSAQTFEQLRLNATLIIQRRLRWTLIRNGRRENQRARRPTDS